MQPIPKPLERDVWVHTHLPVTEMAWDSQYFCHVTGLVLSHLELRALKRFLEYGSDH